MELKDKKILVTGSSKGIGKATALAFAKCGADVIVTYNSDEKGAKETAEKCNGKYFKLDVTDRASIKNLREKIKDIDILINNSGVISWKSLSDQTEKEIENQIDVNFKGLVKVTKTFLEDIEKNSGMIINISSGAGKTGYSNLSVYCATKFAVRGFTQALKGELKNGKIVSVNPGMTKTQMTNFSGVAPEKVAEVIVKTASGEIQPDSKGDVDVWEFV